MAPQLFIILGFMALLLIMALAGYLSGFKNGYREAGYEMALAEEWGWGDAFRRERREGLVGVANEYGVSETVHLHGSSLTVSEYVDGTKISCSTGTTALVPWPIRVLGHSTPGIV